MSNILSNVVPPAASDGVARNVTGGYVIGKVTENNNKDFKGLVKVEFTSWLSGKSICDWIPVMQPYAGAQYGNYVIPEIDDIVVVGFLGASMRKPFVLGSFYPQNAAFINESFDEKNLVKAYKTKGETKFTLNDEPDKQSFTVETSMGLKMSIENETQLITITDKDAKNFIKVDSKNGAMDITADKKMTIKVGKCEIAIDGAGGAVSIKCDKLDIKAGQTATVEGTQALNLKGGNLTVKGSQKTAISGGAMTEVKGGIVKLN